MSLQHAQFLSPRRGEEGRREFPPKIRELPLKAVMRAWIPRPGAFTVSGKPCETVKPCDDYTRQFIGSVHARGYLPAA